MTSVVLHPPSGGADAATSPKHAANISVANEAAAFSAPVSLTNAQVAHYRKIFATYADHGGVVGVEDLQQLLMHFGPLLESKQIESLIRQAVARPYDGHVTFVEFLHVLVLYERQAKTDHETLDHTLDKLLQKCNRGESLDPSTTNGFTEEEFRNLLSTHTMIKLLRLSDDEVEEIIDDVIVEMRRMMDNRMMPGDELRITKEDFISLIASNGLAWAKPRALKPSQRLVNQPSGLLHFRVCAVSNLKHWGRTKRRPKKDLLSQATMHGLGALLSPRRPVMSAAGSNAGSEPALDGTATEHPALDDMPADEVVDYHCMDPMVLIRCGDQSVRTTVQRAQLSPEWGAELTMNFTLPSGLSLIETQRYIEAQRVYVDLFDYQTCGVVPHLEWIAGTSLPLSSVLRCSLSPLVYRLHLRAPAPSPPISIDLNARCNLTVESPVVEYFLPPEQSWLSSDRLGTESYVDRVSSELSAHCSRASSAASGSTAGKRGTSSAPTGDHTTSTAGHSTSKAAAGNAAIAHTAGGQSFIQRAQFVLDYMRRNAPRRHVRMMGLDEFNRYRPLSSFLHALTTPPHHAVFNVGRSAGGDTALTAEQAARSVACIPSRANSIPCDSANVSASTILRHAAQQAWVQHSNDREHTSGMPSDPWHTGTDNHCITADGAVRAGIAGNINVAHQRGVCVTGIGEHAGFQLASPVTLLTRGFASECEKAFLLCSLLLGLKRESYVCFGDGPLEPRVWVCTLLRAGAVMLAQPASSMPTPFTGPSANASYVKRLSHSQGNTVGARSHRRTTSLNVDFSLHRGSLKRGHLPEAHPEIAVDQLRAIGNRRHRDSDDHHVFIGKFSALHNLDGDDVPGLTLSVAPPTPSSTGAPESAALRITLDADTAATAAPSSTDADSTVQSAADDRRDTPRTSIRRRTVSPPPSALPSQTLPNGISPRRASGHDSAHVPSHVSEPNSAAMRSAINTAVSRAVVGVIHWDVETGEQYVYRVRDFGVGIRVPISMSTPSLPTVSAALTAAATASSAPSDQSAGARRSSNEPKRASGGRKSLFATQSAKEQVTASAAAAAAASAPPTAEQQAVAAGITAVTALIEETPPQIICPFARVSCVVAADNTYYNLQSTDLLRCISWQLDDALAWLPFAVPKPVDCPIYDPPPPVAVSLSVQPAHTTDMLSFPLPQPPRRSSGHSHRRSLSAHTASTMFTGSPFTSQLKAELIPSLRSTVFRANSLSAVVEPSQHGLVDGASEVAATSLIVINPVAVPDYAKSAPHLSFTYCYDEHALLAHLQLCLSRRLLDACLTMPACGNGKTGAVHDVKPVNRITSAEKYLTEQLIYRLQLYRRNVLFVPDTRLHADICSALIKFLQSDRLESEMISLQRVWNESAAPVSSPAVMAAALTARASFSSKPNLAALPLGNMLIGTAGSAIGQQIQAQSITTVSPLLPTPNSRQLMLKASDAAGVEGAGSGSGGGFINSTGAGSDALIDDPASSLAARMAAKRRTGPVPKLRSYQSGPADPAATSPATSASLTAPGHQRTSSWNAPLSPSSAAATAVVGSSLTVGGGKSNTSPEARLRMRKTMPLPSSRSSGVLSVALMAKAAAATTAGASSATVGAVAAGAPHTSPGLSGKRGSTTPQLGPLVSGAAQPGALPPAPLKQPLGPPLYRNFLLTDVKQVPPNCIWYGRPFRFTSDDPEDLFRQLQWSGILDCSVPNVMYALAVRIIEHPWGLKTVWVYVGYVYESTSA